MIIDNRSIAFDPKKFNTYIQLIDTNSWLIENSVTDIVKDCNDDTLCSVLNINDYLKNDILLDNDSKTSYSVDNTLKSKTANSTDRNILIATMIKYLGLDTYLIFKKNNLTPYPFLCYINNIDIYSAIKKRTLENPIAKKDMVLKKNQIWIIDRSINSNQKLLAAHIVINSSQNINMKLFPSKEEFDSFISGMSAITLKDCSVDNVKSIDKTCLLAGNVVLAFFSLADNNNFSGTIYHAPPLLNDISSMVIENKECISFDGSAIDQNSYPGSLKINQKDIKEIIKIN